MERLEWALGMSPAVIIESLLTTTASGAPGHEYYCQHSILMSNELARHTVQYSILLT